MRSLIAYTFAAILALMILGCGSTGNNQAIETPTDDVIIPEGPPEFWSDVDCGNNYTITSSGVVVRTTSAGYVWPGLVQNGVLQKWGPAIPVESSTTTVPALHIYLRHDEIPEGDYEFTVYLSPDSSGIGVPSARKTEVLMAHYSLMYPDTANVCIDVLQGDSLYFFVMSSPGTHAIILATNPITEDQGYTWTALRGRVANELIEDTLWFVKLNNNGLFFPLKVSDSIGNSWTLRAEQNVYPHETYEAEIRVSKPSWLGNENNMYDTSIAWYATKYGVPVSILKGMVRRESNFDANSYRYEPTYDYDHLSQRGMTILHESPYNGYNKAIPDSTWPVGPLARGWDLNWRDTVRAVELYGNDVEDLNDDSLLSGREYLCTVTGQNWDSCNSVPASADFIAQTTLAASYGLTQVMWPTAYRPMRWPGIDGHRNPYLLFSPNVSLDIGAKYLRTCYEAEYTGQWVHDWRVALGDYNGGIGTPNYQYADEVLQFANSYHPLD